MTETGTDQRSIKAKLPELALKGSLILLVVFLPYLYLRHYDTMRFDLDYSKFTHKAEHLILGVSRAKVGLVPEVLKEELQLDGEVLNFAFTGLVSPYEERYVKLAMRKVKKAGKNQSGLFILSVNPGNLTKNTKKNRNPPPIYKLFLVNVSPNPDYLFRNINRTEPFLFSLLAAPPEETPMFVAHTDGWGERTRSSAIPDEEIYKKYSASIGDRGLSREYLENLCRLTRYLKDYGEIVLIRMPVKSGMAKIEDESVPDFNQQLSELAASCGAVYLNYLDSGGAYEFSDPHHLLNTGARSFTLKLSEELKTLGIPGEAD